MVNGCHKTLWIAHIVGGGAGPDAQDVKIAPGGNSSFHTGLGGGGLSATRFWPKVGCDASGSHCSVGSSGGPAEACVIRVAGQPDDYSRCAPPVDTKFEATFAAQGSAAQDVLDMSLVDGYTLPFTLEVDGGSCERHGQPFLGMDCAGLSLARCPRAEVLGRQSLSLIAVDPRTGRPAGCYSPCMRLIDDKWANRNGTAVAPDSDAAGPYCCAGAWATPAACNGDGAVLRTEYLKAVKGMCPAAYGYAYDDQTSTISCTTSTRYTVTFRCPDWV